MNNDLISREALKNDLITFSPDKCLEGITAKTLFKQILTDINNAPTVEAYTSEDIVKYISATEDLVREKLERQQGEWIRKVDEVGFVSHICSKCGAEIEVEDCSDDKFCFNCGASMKGGAK